MASNVVKNVAMLTALQMSGMIVLEALAWLLVLFGVLPPTLSVVVQGNTVFAMNTGFLVIAGLFIFLVSGFWLAILAEVFGIIEIKEIKIKL
jgi:hypothetical protein